MTVVTSTSRSGPYAGAGTTGPFTVNFRFLDATHLRVIRTDNTGEHVLTLTTDYSVAGVGNPTGSVTLVAALPVGQTLTIIRDVPKTQEADYVQNDDFPAESHETALDKLTMIAQQTGEQVERTVTFPASDSSSLNKELPTAPMRAFKALVFGADGSVGVSTDNYNDQAANAAASAAAAAASAASASSSANSAAASYDSFDDRWLGPKNSDPTLDNDGNALLEGAAYWNTPGTVLKVWNIATATWYAITSFIQAGVGAIGRTWQDKARERVSVLDYGNPTGSDDTAAFTNAIARISALGGGVVNVPAANWFTGQVTIPSNVAMRLERGAVIKPKAGFALNAFWLTATGAADVEITGGAIEVDRVTFPSTVAIYLDAAQGAKVSDVKLTKSGLIGIFGINCTDVLIERVQSFLSKNRNIQIDGATSARCRVHKCRIDGSGNVDHGISISGGSDHEVTSNYVTATTVFGVSLNTAVRCLVTNNTTFNTLREGINIQDGSDNTVAKNIAFWDNTTSLDFGMSIWGQGANGSNFNIMQGNKIINCGKSGIAIESSTNANFNKVEGNMIVNSNRLNLGVVSGGGAGVILYGTNAQQNDVVNNRIYDNIGFLKHGVFEWNQGGQATNNRIFNNPTTNAAISNVNKTAASVEAFNQTVWQAYTPTITSGTGTITTLGTVLGRYWETDKLVHFYISIGITTNGTGAQDIRATLPFTNSSVSSLAYGRESGVTGVAVTGTIAANAALAIVRKYDNSYPGANGAVIEIQGAFVKA